MKLVVVNKKIIIDLHHHTLSLFKLSLSILKIYAKLEYTLKQNITNIVLV